MHDDFTVPADWYKTFFTAPVNLFWERMVPPEATEADLGFLLRHLGAIPPARILDVPCGSGRHALGLARAGYRVTGVDLSDDAIKRASATAREAGLPARFIKKDMRDFEAEEPFDAAICLGNSISYFERDGMRSLFDTLAAGTRRGGRGIDLPSPRGSGPGVRGWLLQLALSLRFLHVDAEHFGGASTGERAPFPALRPPYRHQRRARPHAWRRGLRSERALRRHRRHAVRCRLPAPAPDRQARMTRSRLVPG
jgi:SAM-dependent methyltransferase